MTLRIGLERGPTTSPSTELNRAAFAAAFPEDLPLGEYKIDVVLQDRSGVVLDHLERTFVKRAKTDEFEKLDNETLLAEYVRRGEALRGTTVEPIEADFGRVPASWPYEHPKRRAWVAAHDEIIRRGAIIVPDLMKQLAIEAVRNLGKDEWRDAGFGLAFEVMDMLVRIDDPRPVDQLIDIASGLHGRANVAVRRKALESCRCSTHFWFSSDHDHICELFAVLV